MADLKNRESCKNHNGPMVNVNLKVVDEIKNWINGLIISHLKSVVDIENLLN